MTTQELYSLNSSILTNPNQIYPGMQLRVVNRCGGGGNNGGGGSSGGVCDRGPSPTRRAACGATSTSSPRGDTSYSDCGPLWHQCHRPVPGQRHQPVVHFRRPIAHHSGADRQLRPVRLGQLELPAAAKQLPDRLELPADAVSVELPAGELPDRLELSAGQLRVELSGLHPVPMPTVVPVTPVPHGQRFRSLRHAGADLAQTFTVTGSGQGLFEGNVVVQAQNSAGGLLAQQATTLQGSNVGAGGPGTFSVQLTVPVSIARVHRRVLAPVAGRAGESPRHVHRFGFRRDHVFHLCAGAMPGQRGGRAAVLQRCRGNTGRYIHIHRRLHGDPRRKATGRPAMVRDRAGARRRQCPCGSPTSSTTSVSAGCAW